MRIDLYIHMYIDLSNTHLRTTLRDLAPAGSPAAHRLRLRLWLEE